jgi:hypothetical protein
MLNDKQTVTTNSISCYVLHNNNNYTDIITDPESGEDIVVIVV